MSTMMNEYMNENMLGCTNEYNGCWDSWKPEWERFDNCWNDDQELVNQDEEEIYHSVTQDAGGVCADDVEYLDANKDE